MNENDRNIEKLASSALKVDQIRGIADVTVHLHQLEHELETSLTATASILVQKKQAVEKALEDQRLASAEAKRFFQKFRHNMKRESVDSFVDSVYWDELMLTNDMIEMLELKAGSQLSSRAKPKSVYVVRCEVCDSRIEEVLAKSRSERDTLLKDRRAAVEASTRGGRRDPVICRFCYRMMGRQRGPSGIAELKNARRDYYSDCQEG